MTAAVKLGRVPDAWVEQTKPGGTIIAPVKTDLLQFTISQGRQTASLVA